MTTTTRILARTCLRPANHHDAALQRRQHQPALRLPLIPCCAASSATRPPPPREQTPGARRAGPIPSFPVPVAIPHTPATSLLSSLASGTHRGSSRSVSFAQLIHQQQHKPPVQPQPKSWRQRVRLFLLGDNPARRLRMDDVAAMFSWVGIGALLFVVAGTTSAVSLVLVTANSTDLREYLADRIAAYLSNLTGYEVSFESAVVPNWREGTIQFSNVSIKCDKDTWTARVAEERRKAALTARSSSSKSTTSNDADKVANGVDLSDIDLNWTYWDLNVNTINVSLSLWRYWQGLGLVKACKLSGVRGMADRSHITWPQDWTPTLRQPTSNDFHMDEFIVEDLLLTVKNPGDFRPFNVSVYSARLPLFRQQWLLYDVMCADSIVGAFDNCLFSVHKWKQAQTTDSVTVDAEMSHLKINGLPIQHFNNGVTGPFGWITSGSIDIDVHFLFPQHQDDQLFAQIRQEFDQFKYVAMDKLEGILDRYEKQKNNTSRDTWLGDDWVVDDTNPVFQSIRALRKYMKPKQVRSEITGTEYIESDLDVEEDKQLIGTYEPRQYPSRYAVSIRERRDAAKTATTPAAANEFKVAPEDAALGAGEPGGAPQFLFMHWGICLNDLRASVPLSTPHISYMNNALIRPVVGYMNAHRFRIPLTFEARPKLTNFDGSWDFFSCGLVDIAAEEIGRALTLLVLDERERTRHLKRIGLWSLQNATKNLMELIAFVRGSEFPQQYRAF
ncbi:Mitochondrial distribution and morphology protein 31, mitochondrial precursor, partial [Entophlyctis sp. JEL0112]